MSQRREKRLRQLERRVAALEAQRTDHECEAAFGVVCAPTSSTTVPTKHRSAFQKVVDFFKGR